LVVGISFASFFFMCNSSLSRLKSLAFSVEQNMVGQDMWCNASSILDGSCMQMDGWRAMEVVA
jgi:hypothetical protein